MVLAIDFLWACNFGGTFSADAYEGFLSSIQDRDPRNNTASLTRRIYRKTLAPTSYSDKSKRKILDNRLIWLLCTTLKQDLLLPSQLPEIRGSDKQWDELWDITPFANHVGRWQPMSSHYSNTHMAEWIMQCEICIFANKAPPSAQDTVALRRGSAVEVVEILVNLQNYLSDKAKILREAARTRDLREVLGEFFLRHLPPTLWGKAFPACDRDQDEIQSTLAKNIDLVLAAVGLLGDRTFEEAFKIWYSKNINSQPNPDLSIHSKPMFPDTTVLGMFPATGNDQPLEFRPTDLDAWFINSGRFKLKSTRDLKQHLELDQSIRTVYVYIGPNTFENGRLALLHDTPIARYSDENIKLIG